jgi:hypothetical protein
MLVDHFRLGRRGVTDLLAVSLSATDFVGHGYGTQGPEMCDHLFRLDAQIGSFLTFLDGLGLRVLVAMTGDHGGSDFVERLALMRHRSRAVNRALATIAPYDATPFRKRCRPNAWAGAFEFRLPAGWSLTPASPL